MIYHREQELMAMDEYTKSPVSIHKEGTCIESMGDASKEGGNFSADVGKLAERTSPAYTREELVGVMCNAYVKSKGLTFHACAGDVLDALIACGALKVRGGQQWIISNNS